MQQRLKALARAAGAQVVAAQLLDELLVVDEAQASLDSRLGVKTRRAAYACDGRKLFFWVTAPSCRRMDAQRSPYSL